MGTFWGCSFVSLFVVSRRGLGRLVRSGFIVSVVEVRRVVGW